MNAAVIMQTCPEQETLAAFIDGRLDERSRKEVIEHLVDCGECTDVVVTANEYSSSVEPAQGGEVVRGRFGGRRALAALVAVAAGVGVVFLGPPIWERVRPKSPMEQLVAAANGLEKRRTEARLSGDFVWRDYSNPRGGGDSPAVDPLAPVNVQIAAAEITDDTPHDRGVADLLTQNVDAAVKALERAAEANPSSAAIQNDLAAAYLARADDKYKDHENALAAAKRSWAIQQTSAAAWNIALALERLGRDAEAIAAWNQYLKLDSNSAWANEVRTKHLYYLQLP